MSTKNHNNPSPRSLVRPAAILAAAASLLLAPCLFAQAPATSAQSGVEQSTDAGAPWVKERFGRPTPNVLHWSVEPAVTKTFEPSGVFEQVIQCGEFTALSNYGLYWSGEGDTDDSKDMEASVVILKGQQRVFVARGYQFDKFNYDAPKKALNFRYWTGVQGDGQVVEFTLDFASGTIQPKARTLSTKGEPEPSAVQKGGTAKAANPKFYTLNFDRGNVLKLSGGLRKAFPNDNFVVSESVERLELPGFDLRNARLTEIGRTIEFLSDGQLRVEIAENAGSGNIWRIGPVQKSSQAAAAKMRSVAAPNLFSSKEALDEIQNAAEEMERMRLNMIDREGGNLRRVTMRPLASQKVFAIIGDEEGVAGLESLIKAAEQRLADAAAAKVAAFAANAPKMRAVLAPHVFDDAERARKLMDSLNSMRDELMAVRMDIEKELGKDIIMQAPWAAARPRPEQKVFVLSGTEAGIAGMDSLIKAAEQLAEEEDALLKARRVKAEAIKAEEQATEKPAKQGKGE